MYALYCNPEKIDTYFKVYVTRGNIHTKRLYWLTKEPIIEQTAKAVLIHESSSALLDPSSLITCSNLINSIAHHSDYSQLHCTPLFSILHLILRYPLHFVYVLNIFLYKKCNIMLCFIIE